MAKPTDMQQRELNGKTILLVEVPPQDEIQSIVWDIARLQIFKKGGELVAKRPMPPGDWKFFAFTDTIKEKQAAELVECSMYGYRDYERSVSGFPFATAKESFQSWLHANGIPGNNAILIKQLTPVLAKAGD